MSLNARTGPKRSDAEVIKRYSPKYQPFLSIGETLQTVVVAHDQNDASPIACMQRAAIMLAKEELPTKTKAPITKESIPQIMTGLVPILSAKAPKTKRSAMATAKKIVVCVPASNAEREQLKAYNGVIDMKMLL